MKKYYIVWKTLAANALQETFVNRGTQLLFFIGKLLRFTFSILFLLLLRQHVPQFGTYTTDHIMVFYVTYLLIDTITQVFFRGVYLFSNQVRTGEFDFFLAKPMHPLFQVMTGKPDINDSIFLLPTTLVSWYLLLQLDLTITVSSFVLYILLLFNGLLLATAIHILVLVVGILTTEVDGTIWMYRDLIRLGQFPVTMYAQPLRLALFVIVPVGFMITIPAQALVSLALPTTVIASLLFGALFFYGSLKLWHWSLKQYQSASS